MGASDLLGGGHLGDGIMGDALVVKTWPVLDVHELGTEVKTWPLVEVKEPGTASLLTPGDPCGLTGTPGCVSPCSLDPMRRVHLASGRALHLLRHIGHLSRIATFMSSVTRPCGFCLLCAQHA